MREEKYVKESDQLDDEETPLTPYQKLLAPSIERQRQRGKAQARGQAEIDKRYGPTNTIAGRPKPPAASTPQPDSSSYANAAPPTSGTLTRINPNNTTPLVKGQPYSPSTPPAGGNMRKVRPGETPISEADVRGQTKFDFEGAKTAREERERIEAAEDREFDRTDPYRRPRPVAPIKKPKKR
jgi:hypothetical protein